MFGSGAERDDRRVAGPGSSDPDGARMTDADAGDPRFTGHLLAQPADEPPGRRRFARARREDAWRPRRGLSLTLGVALVLLAVAVTARERGQSDTVGGTAGGAPSLAIRPPVAFDLGQPFAGTPAAGWVDGADGIAVPPARPVGGYSSAEVADALARTKEVLTVAHLGQAMLIGHNPTAYVALLAPNARGQERASIGGGADPDEGGEVTLFAPGFHLLPVPVKVNGSMTVTTDAHGQLVVHANYVFAYPFAPTDSTVITQSWQLVAVQHVAEDVTLIAGAHYARGDRGLWVTASRSYYESIACGAARRGYLAPAYSEPRHDQVPTTAGGDPNQYYDPNHPLNVSTTCPS